MDRDVYTTSRSIFFANRAQPGSILVAPKMFQRFMFCISEIFIENFQT